jgi:hypothetical protein
MGMKLVAGRDFAESDTAESLPVALVNEAFARRYFGQENPAGHKIRWDLRQGLWHCRGAMQVPAPAV